MRLPGRSSWFPSTEVHGARDGSWGHRCFTFLYLVAKPSHVGGDVDGPAYCLWVTDWGTEPLDRC
jgi:hypothetical protein